MPMRKRSTRRPRRVVRRRRVARRRGRISQNTKTQCTIAIRKTYTVSSSTSITGVGQYIWEAYSPLNAKYVNMLDQPEWALHKNLWDEVCIKSMTIKYRPRVTDINVSDGVSENFILTFVDRDGNTPVSTSTGVPEKIQAYDSFKRYSMLRPFTRTVKLVHHWFDTSLVAQSGASEAYRQLGVLGCVGLYGQQLPLNWGSVGDVEVTYHLAFRGKKPTQFSMDGENVVIQPESSIEELPPVSMQT